MKLSSEAAGMIAVTPVVVQELTPRELIEHMLGITGKNEGRIREILRRGTLVSGASRFRWESWEADPEALRRVLAGFPDPDPSIPFSKDRCLRAVLRGNGRPLELRREVMSRKPLFQRQSFWDSLMEITSASAAAYSGYSYGDRADCYLRQYTPEEIERLRGASDRLPDRAWRDSIRSARFSNAEFYVARAQ